MRTERTSALAFALTLAAAFAGAPTPALGQTLSPGDRLVYETVAAFGFELPHQTLRDPCSLETRLSVGIARVDPTGMDVEVEISIGVRAVRYRGPTFCWALEPATPDGFIERPLAAHEAAHLAGAVLPRTTPPLVVELVRKELTLAAAVASLHGHKATARVACGRDPFVRIDALDASFLTAAHRLAAERYLRSALLLAFPPVPLDLKQDAEGFDAGGSRYEVTGLRDSFWPIPGRAHRVRAVEPSSAARAAFAFEAMNDTGLEPVEGDAPRVREWSDIHARLGIARGRHVRVASPLAERDAARRAVIAVASWHADLVSADRREDGASPP